MDSRPGDDTLLLAVAERDMVGCVSFDRGGSDVDRFDQPA
jgi:hypothetical protein